MCPLTLDLTMVKSTVANGEDLRDVWKAINDLRADVAVLLDRWTELRQRQSQIPTFVWLAITVLLTAGLWLADRIVPNAP